MITFKKFTLETVNFQDWDSFVDESNNGTIFHKATFYLYHEIPKPVSFFEFYYKNQKVACCIGAVIGNEFKSPFAASYGGICWANRVRFSIQESVIDFFETEMKNNSIQKIQFVHAPICYQKYTDQSLEFLFHYRNYIQDQTLISSVLNLDEFALNDCSDLAKRNFKNSQKKQVVIQFESTKNIEDSYALLIKNKEKYGLKPTHSLLELKKLSTLFQDKIQWANAYVDGKMIASIVNFICSSKTILAFYISTNYDFNEYHAVNYLLIQCALEYKKRGYSYYDLGVSMETDTNNPMDPRRSLIFFKEHFITRGQLRPRFVKTIS
jgi:hypothetical protein